MEKYHIVAPEDAVVDRIVKGTTGVSASSLTVVLQCNPYWYGLLTFEPQSMEEAPRPGLLRQLSQAIGTRRLLPVRVRL